MIFDKPQSFPFGKNIPGFKACAHTPKNLPSPAWAARVAEGREKSVVPIGAKRRKNSLFPAL
jgi:hypothetical protein